MRRFTFAVTVLIPSLAIIAGIGQADQIRWTHRSIYQAIT
jgi:hypothetical protein